MNEQERARIKALLSSEPVAPNSGDAPCLHGAAVMVTGAGGSIGSELCVQVAAHGPRSLVLLDQAESAIYRIDKRLRGLYPNLEIHPVVADILNWHRLDRVMAEHKPGIVFHAAAYKHVPLMELNREEVVINNVLGVTRVLSLSAEYGMERFVLISTDKAVDPSSHMGASKRIAEMLVRDAARRAGGRYVTVRFGNVLGSDGSVVPLFEEQIAAGGPVTVTHPEMERYFMTVHEAVHLVIQAAAMGQAGEVFMLDMGKPIKIVDLARAMIEMSGRDIEIEFTGLRPGEKLRESLVNGWEEELKTSHKKILSILTGRLMRSIELHRRTGELIEAARCGEVDRLYDLMCDIAPECGAMD